MTKLCPRGKAAAKRKFKVYPSAYANAYASKICAGKIKDPSGVKRKDFKGHKPSSASKGMMTEFDDGGQDGGQVGGHSVMGSPVSVDVDGDTLSNPSASAYYKDLLK